jgi:transcriptional regulator with XRE-family HTH domain
MMLTAFLPVPPANASPMPRREVGTGGLALEAFLTDVHGYGPVHVIVPYEPVQSQPYVKLMEEVRSGFGRTMSRLTEVFGVSRQTLYNWLEGETPKPAHQERLRQLADAAGVLAELNIKPTSLMLDRTVADAKSFLQLLAEGANGKEAARKLVRIHQRGQASRDQLDVLLGSREKPRPSAGDFGAESFDERA